MNEPHAPPAENHAVAAERMTSLTRILRSIGAVALLASASTFLVQHWEAGNDLQRYGSLLLHTALLAMAGFFCGLRIHDAKGARTFLAVAAAIVPAHFCILGGLVYSQLSLDGALVPVAGYATWTAPTATAALAVSAGGVIVLAGVALISFLALARARAGELTLYYLAANLPMLLPTRSPDVVGVLVAALIGLGLHLELVRFRGDALMQTLEGRFVRLMLWAPVVLVGMRSLLHYELSWLFHTVVWGTLAVGATLIAREHPRLERMRGLLQTVSMASAAAACFAFAGMLAEDLGLPSVLVIPAAALPFSAALTGISMAEIGNGARLRGAAAIIALGSLCVNLMLFPGVAAALPCLAVGVTTLAYGFMAERRGVFLAGCGASGYALLHHLAAAIEIYAWSHWGSLALLGALVILGAALLERHGDRVGSLVIEVRGRLNGSAD